MATKKKKPESFEAALAELDTIVQQLERGELPLTQALDAFKQGVEKTLHDAQETVANMMAEEGDFVLDEDVQ